MVIEDYILKKKPDVIIPFCNPQDKISPCVVIYVRPTTNKLNYEKNIILAIQEFGDVVYLANINGIIFLRNYLLMTHYSTQYYFSVYSKKVIGHYKEMITKFEEHFGESFKDSKIIGAFDYIEFTKKSPNDLFNTIVDNKDFLKLYGQSIKKIDSYYVVNYDIPKIFTDYNIDTNVFVIACVLKDKDIKITDLNKQIFENLTGDNSTPIIDNALLGNLSWSEMVRRTYHISSNFLASIYDILDFVFTQNGDEINVNEIPFCKKLFDENILTPQEFLEIKDFNLVYIEDEGGIRLTNMLEECNNKSLDEVFEVFKKINYNKIGTPLFI